MHRCELLDAMAQVLGRPQREWQDPWAEAQDALSITSLSRIVKSTDRPDVLPASSKNHGRRRLSIADLVRTSKEHVEMDELLIYSWESKQFVHLPDPFPVSHHLICMCQHVS